jgi:hypothetical protein
VDRRRCRARCWQFADRCHDIRLRLEARDDLFDLPLALVGRFAKNVGVILLCEMRRQDADGTEMDAAICEERQYQREPSRRARSFDPVVRRMLGEMQHLRAVREHRGGPLSEVEPPRVELHERGDQMRGRAALTSGQTLHFRNQLAVGKTIMNEG